MMCKNLRKRSKKYYSYFYCVKNKRIVSKEDCFNCEEKEYKKVKKMKYRTSKRSIACDIPIKVKRIVAERDNDTCIICGRRGIPESHYIRRGQGGLGIEENVVCMCRFCHGNYDNGTKEEVKMIHDKTRNYLKRQYGENWKEENLYYKKGGI